MTTEKTMSEITGKRSYRATLPDGTVEEKKETFRTYTHVLAWFVNDAWTLGNWCGSAALAEKATSEARRRGATETRVLPVTHVRQPRGEWVAL